MARKALYFDSFCGYITAVVTENGRICEFDFEKAERGTIVGNIYKGRVESILPGIQAAFINCGLEKNCYLSADDILPDKDKYDIGSYTKPLFPNLTEGEEILVQVVKAPIGKKGAKVTAYPSLVGKSLIYMPNTPFVGVSRKISDEELRRNLAFTAERLKSAREGLVIRTAAPYCTHSQLETEFKFLKNIYAKVRESYKTAQVGDLLFTDSSLHIRVLRDTLLSDISEITVGSRELLTGVEQIVSLYPTRRKRSVIMHDTGRDMFDELGIAQQIAEIVSPRVNLENGAHLVIEKTEALTVIDVNTGKFTGSDNLEQTVYFTNILAAREIARQVRLRNIGGIVVVDFIDMQSQAHKKAVVEELEKALKSDKSKCAVSPMSKFGLVEFTRKRIGPSVTSLILKPCRHCGETGHTMAEEFILFSLRAKLLNIFAEKPQTVRLDLNADILYALVHNRELLSNLKAHCNGIKLFAVPHKTYHEEQINIRTDKFEIPENALDIL